MQVLLQRRLQAEFEDDGNALPDENRSLRQLDANVEAVARSQLADLQANSLRHALDAGLAHAEGADPDAARLARDVAIAVDEVHFSRTPYLTVDDREGLAGRGHDTDEVELTAIRCRSV